MPEEIGTNHPHYALLAYAQEMHQYTLELWMQLSKKLDLSDDHSVPTTTHTHHDPSGDPPPGDAGLDDTDAESPQDE